MSITITDSALNKINNVLSNKDVLPFGIRIGVNQKGCSGHSYYMDFVDNPESNDSIITINNINFIIDEYSLTFLNGMEVDYKDESIKSGFVFNNPNAKSMCGCGESFCA